MIILDANVLLYAHDLDDARHPVVRDWLAATLASEPDVRIALVSALAFIRIATDGRVYERPLEPAEAIAIVGDLLGRPNVSLVGPTDRHWARLAEAADTGRARGPLLMDAHLVALAAEHGATIATTDRDFARFAGVRVVDPLAA